MIIIIQCGSDILNRRKIEIIQAGGTAMRIRKMKQLLAACMALLIAAGTMPTAPLARLADLPVLTADAADPAAPETPAEVTAIRCFTSAPRFRTITPKTGIQISFAVICATCTVFH